ncbi:hypothetical protein QBC40DRAFT_229088 [Triangularia verruculosa]|uniref:Uncharacterized protein n=1 Tax=Triangularia verruculosa TaxID=2587418 RepID=A0AAN6XG14_9PEZI|nr:hypothetical protein QBC40DRAFT_229088 [Triangularia verruculosa]
MVSVTPPSSQLTMESIKSSLTDQDLSNAQEVATILLDVYKTLVRMQYLPGSDLREGPHDLTDMLPLYQDLQLDPRIIYLYTLLPYFDNILRFGSAFYKGGLLVDFRNKDYVEEVRNPFFRPEDRREMMRPWMTPLSLCCGLQVVLIYDAKRHVLGVYELCHPNSQDPALDWTLENRLESADDLPQAFGDDEDEDEDDERLGLHPRLGCGAEGGNIYDRMPARDAGDVLRDILKQYEKLEDAPWRYLNGGAGGPWPEGIEKLYHKHGWPGPDFDVEGFHVDRIRMDAVEKTMSYALGALNKVREEKNRLQRLNQEMLVCKHALVRAETPGQEWIAKFDIWKLELNIDQNKKRLAGAEKLVARLYPKGSSPSDRSEDVIVWELRYLTNALRCAAGSLQPTTKQAESVAASREAVATELSEEEKRNLERIRRATHACLMDADRLCPNREVLPENDNDIKVVNYVFNRECQVAYHQGRKESLEGFLATIPPTCQEAREVVQTDIDRCQQDIDKHKKIWDERDAMMEAVRKRNEAAAVAAKASV